MAILYNFSEKEIRVWFRRTIIVVYVTCHQRLLLYHWIQGDEEEEKIKMYRILWMTVNSNWSLMDNGFSSEMYLIKDHDI